MTPDASKLIEMAKGFNESADGIDEDITDLQKQIEVLEILSADYRLAADVMLSMVRGPTKLEVVQ